LCKETDKTLRQTKKETFIFFCTTILVLAPLYITLYTCRGPIAIAIDEVMPQSRVMYSNTNKRSSSTLNYANNNTRLTHLSGHSDSI